MRIFASAIATLLLGSNCSAFSTVPAGTKRSTELLAHDRRAFLGAAVSAVVAPFPVLAEDMDMTKQLFNEDGSLKEEMETEAKFRKVELTWNSVDQLQLALDGANAAGTEKGSSVQVSYKLPEKWGTGSDLYFDQKEGAKACDRITVYQATGTANMKRLEKASVTGIGKALDVPDDMKEVRSADLIGGRTAVKDGQKFYEFDMAVAPKTCESSKEDLGLGFCPYDTIYLLSSTVIADRLYVFALKCDKSEWQRANSDLRRVRSSFAVQQV